MIYIVCLNQKTNFTLEYCQCPHFTEGKKEKDEKENKQNTLQDLYSSICFTTKLHRICKMTLKSKFFLNIGLVKYRTHITNSCL